MTNPTSLYRNAKSNFQSLNWDTIDDRCSLVSEAIRMQLYDMQPLSVTKHADSEVVKTRSPNSPHNQHKGLCGSHFAEVDSVDRIWCDEFVDWYSGDVSEPNEKALAYDENCSEQDLLAEVEEVLDCIATARLQYPGSR